MSNKFYTCRYDVAFKEVFMKEDNKDILIALLESILNIKIKELAYLNNEKYSDNVNIRRKHFDLHIKTEEENIQIEVNNYINDYTRPRNMAYICNTYSHVILRGDEYNEQIQIIQVNFTYGLNKIGKFHDTEKLRVYYMQDNSNIKYVNNMIIYELNMDYFMKLWYSSDEKEIEKYKYIIMLDLKKKDLENLSKKDKVINKYMEAIEKINEDPDFYEYMSAEEDNRKIENSLRSQWKREGLEAGMKQGIKQGIKQGVKQGVKQGIEQGTRQTKEEIAKKLKEKGIDSDTILEITDIEV